ncbi:MAG TPA: hypothetical protein VFQ76_00365 [Longimicrobiaceae bacterium]|nr:hypothetical protein [Longimicrobiaceae bacterium]
MRQPSPALSELARQLLRHEAGGSPEPQAMAAAVERACEKLSGEMENLVGPGGAVALVRRARTLAKREFVDAGSGSAAPGPGQAEAESAAVLAHLVGLLVGLLGEELGLRPVRKIWPDVASGEGTPSSTETEG